MAIASIYGTLNRRTILIQRDPRVFIILQNHETAQQVYDLFNKISDNVDLKVVSAIGSVKKNMEIRQIKNSGADIVICTTGRFIDYVDQGLVSFLGLYNIYITWHSISVLPQYAGNFNF